MKTSNTNSGLTYGKGKRPFNKAVPISSATHDSSCECRPGGKYDGTSYPCHCQARLSGERKAARVTASRLK